MAPSMILITGLFYIALAGAAVTFADINFANITAGHPSTIIWNGAASSVTLTLRNFTDLENPTTILSIGTGLTKTSYIWNVPTTLPNLDYSIQIEDSQSTNYSPEFQIAGSDEVGSLNLNSALATSTPTLPTSTSSSSSTKPSTSSSSSTTSTTTPLTSSSTVSLPQKSSLKAESKAGIGAGASIVGILLIALVGFFFFQQGRRVATKKAVSLSSPTAFEKAELSPGLPLSKEEKDDLQERRRFAEMQGLEIAVPPELEGQNSERWELEAMKERAVARSELA